MDVSRTQDGSAVIDASDGVEAEQEEDLPIEHPFNPEKIRIATTNILAQQLSDRIKHGEIELAPEFQRMPGIWGRVKKSRLIESLLLRIPIPVFYVAADTDERWSIVDGLQRISSIHGYYQGDFRLRGLEYLVDLEGKKYADLPRKMVRRINETQLMVNVIEPGTPSELMFNIFRRINTGGVSLNHQEIRHALYSGPIRAYLKKLSESHDFLDATDNSIKPDRMMDRECILRFLAFFVRPLSDYHNSDLDTYLVNTIKLVNEMDENKRNNIENKFLQAMLAAKKIFGKKAFRKPNSNSSTRINPINKSLFETWSVHLARCQHSEIDLLVKQKKSIQTRFNNLVINDLDFHGSISTSTGNPKQVRKRFEEVRKIIEECL